MAKRERRWFRRILGLGILAGGAYALWRAIEADRDERGGGDGWEPQPFPFPPQPRPPSEDD